MGHFKDYYDNPGTIDYKRGNMVDIIVIEKQFQKFNSDRHRTF
jgi:hypothetical protein